MSSIQNFIRLRSRSSVAASLLVVVFIAGCATADVTMTRTYTGEKLARPSRILVYDFTSDINEMPMNSPLRKSVSLVGLPDSVVNSDISKRLGTEIALNLAAEIKMMGLPGTRAMRLTTARPGDIVLKGYFSSLDAGSAAQRMAMGFGSGAAELTVTVEGYQMTDKGLRFLGSGEGSAGSGKTPGTALSLGVAVATANPVGLIVSGAAKAAGEATGKETIEGASKRITKLISARLQTAFQRQGWI